MSHTAIVLSHRSWDNVSIVTCHCHWWYRVQNVLVRIDEEASCLQCPILQSSCRLILRQCIYCHLSLPLMISPSECACSNRWRSFLSAMSHTAIVLSLDPETMYLLSLVTAIDDIESECACSNRWRSFLSAMSHTAIVLSCRSWDNVFIVTCHCHWCISKSEWIASPIYWVRTWGLRRAFNVSDCFCLKLIIVFFLEMFYKKSDFDLIYMYC